MLFMRKLSYQAYKSMMVSIFRPEECVLRREVELHDLFLLFPCSVKHLRTKPCKLYK